MCGSVSCLLSDAAETQFQSPVCCNTVEIYVALCTAKCRICWGYLWLSKNTKIQIYRTIILPVVLYGCRTWSLTLRGKDGLRVFEVRVLREIFGSKRDEVTRVGEDYITRSFVLCTAH